MNNENGKKKFSDTTIGRAIWSVGDTLKGKTKAGKALDGILEVVPVPNPIRFVREADQKKKLEKVSRNLVARNALANAGVDIDELIGEQPGWVVPVVAGVVFTTLIVLLATGIIDQQTFMEIINLIMELANG